MVHKDFNFLPPPFSSAGLIANLTLASGQLNYYNELNGEALFVKDFPNLSEITHNTTLYYETGRWGGRLSSTYRSRYISEVDSDVLDDEDERGFHSTNYLDGSLYHRINDQIKITFEAINLTNEREIQYSSSADRPYNTTTSGTTYYVGFSYQF